MKDQQWLSDQHTPQLWDQLKKEEEEVQHPKKTLHEGVESSLGVAPMGAIMCTGSDAGNSSNPRCDKI